MHRGCTYLPGDSWMISHMQSNRISHVTPDHVFNSSPLCEFVVALTYFVQQTLYSGSCGFIPIGLTDFMPPRPCKPSESWALMHRLPYFSTKLTVACGKATLCVCVCVQLCRFWKRPCVLSALVLDLQNLVGMFPQNHALVGWLYVFISPSHHKEDKLLHCRYILY